MRFRSDGRCFSIIDRASGGCEVILENKQEGLFIDHIIMSSIRNCLSSLFIFIAFQDIISILSSIAASLPLDYNNYKVDNYLYSLSPFGLCRTADDEVVG